MVSMISALLMLAAASCYKIWPGEQEWRAAPPDLVERYGAEVTFRVAEDGILELEYSEDRDPARFHGMHYNRDIISYLYQLGDEYHAQNPETVHEDNEDNEQALL